MNYLINVIEFGKNNLIVLGVTIGVLFLVVITMFFRKNKSNIVANEGIKKVEKPHDIFGFDTVIVGFKRVDKKKINVEFNSNDKNNFLEFDFSIEEDCIKFDNLFIKNSKFDELKKVKKYFNDEGIINEVRRYLIIRLKEINDSITYNKLLDDLDEYFKNKFFLLKKIQEFSQSELK